MDRQTNTQTDIATTRPTRPRGAKLVKIKNLKFLYGISATFRTCREIQCLQYAGSFDYLMIFLY